MEQTKKCKRCKEVKNVEDFAKSARRNDGMQTWCKDCVKEQDHVRYEQDKKKHRSWNMTRKERHYDKVTDYLKEHPCVDCSEPDPIVLEFDHRDPEIKDNEVTQLISYASWDRILAEIKKCDVVCSNCHRKRTAKQFGWRRWKQIEAEQTKQKFDDALLDQIVMED